MTTPVWAEKKFKYLRRIPEPIDIYKEVKLKTSREKDLERRDRILSKLWQNNIEEKYKWLKYRDLLLEIRNYNYEALEFFQPTNQIECIGEGRWPVEKILLKGKGNDPVWVLLVDFDFDKDDEGLVKEKMVYIKLTIRPLEKLYPEK